MSTDPDPTSLSPSRVSGLCSAWLTTVSRCPSSRIRRVPVPRRTASRSGAWSGLEQGMRWISASSGSSAAHTEAHSSAPWTSPEGEETATSASSSRTARRAISAAPACTHGSMRRHGTNVVGMPELPEMEITARRLGTVLPGETLESALTPGINVLKTFDPPLHAIEGGTFTGVRRKGKLLLLDLDTAAGEPLTLLTHLMSAGRMQLFDKRGSLRDRTSRVLLRLSDPAHPDREL